MINNEGNNIAKLDEDYLETPKNTLGVVGTLRYLELFYNGGIGDYTSEKYTENIEEPFRKRYTQVIWFVMTGAYE